MNDIGGLLSSGFNPAQMMNGAGNKFKTADTDGSSTISKLEFGAIAEENGLDASKMEKMFNQMDSNRDGEISHQERQDMKESMEQRMGSLGGAGGNKDSFDSVKALMESLQSDSDDEDEKQLLEDALEKMRNQGYSESIMDDSLSLLNSTIPTINLTA